MSSRTNLLRQNISHEEIVDFYDSTKRGVCLSRTENETSVKKGVSTHRRGGYGGWPQGLSTLWQKTRKYVLDYEKYKKSSEI